MSVSPPTLPKNISIISITRDTADRPLVMPSVSPTVPIAELVSNSYKNVTIVTPTGSIDVTDSKTRVPDGLFAASSSNDNKEDN